MTLVFLHGAGFTGDVFREQMDAFPGSFAPNLPGHEREGAPGSIEEFSAFVESYVRGLDANGVVLCGHSMGGAIALDVALARRVPVAAVVALGSGARLRVAPAILDALRTAFDDASREIARSFFADPTPQRIAWAVEFMHRVGGPQTLRDFEACNAFDALDRLAALRVPLLALTGAHDVLTPPKYAQALADRVGNGRARILGSAGHLLMVERPAETNAEIAAFLRGIA